MLALAARLNRVWDARGARGWLERYAVPADRACGKLSGGQRAQVAFAVALGSCPDVLLLDEPLSNLDPLVPREVMADLLDHAAAPLPQVGYVLFAFALGLVCSVLTRRTLVAMGTSLAAFLVTRYVVGVFLRPHYESPLRASTGIGSNAPVPVPDDALRAGGGYLGASGAPASYPEACNAPRVAGAQSYEDCLRGHGIAARYVDYQPPDRVGEFQAIEFGIFAVLAILLFGATWRLVRRTRRL